MRRSTGFAVGVPASLALVALACGYDITTQRAQSGNPVATYLDPGADFATRKTFAIVNKLGIAADGGVEYQSAPGVLGVIVSNLEARGFQKVAEIDPAYPPSTPVPAALSVNVTALEAAGDLAAYLAGYPEYLGPATWGYGGYAWYHPWDWVPLPSKPWTLLVEIGDLAGAAPGGGMGATPITVLWASLGYGVLAAGDLDTSQAADSVNRAFAQSPYLASP
jgi:hypothetical protein